MKTVRGGIGGSVHNRYSPGSIFIGFVLFIAAALTFYPFFYIVLLAVMPYENYLRSAIHFMPNGFTAQYFINIFSDPNLPHGFAVSIQRVLIGTSLNVVCTIMAAYAVANPKLRYKKFFSIVFLVPMYFHAGIIPYYLTLRTVGLLNTFWALILPGLVSPMWFFIARAALVKYPVEILDAAQIDGSGSFQTLWRIVLPTNKPIIATLCMVYGVSHWNEYFMTRLIVPKSMWTAPVHLYSLMHSQRLLQGLDVGVKIQPQSYTAAIAACLIIPVFFIYPFLQRYIISGLTVGAVKE